jgi:hypothetical protein
MLSSGERLHTYLPTYLPRRSTFTHPNTTHTHHFPAPPPPRVGLCILSTQRAYLSRWGILPHVLAPLACLFCVGGTGVEDETNGRVPFRDTIPIYSL